MFGRLKIFRTFEMRNQIIKNNLNKFLRLIFKPLRFKVIFYLLVIWFRSPLNLVRAFFVTNFFKYIKCEIRKKVVA